MQAQNAILLVDVKTMRFHWEPYVRKLAESLNLALVSTLYGKSAFDESHPLFMGMYGGAFGRQDVRSLVESADCVIAAGFVEADGNTANFTAKLDPLRLIDIQPSKVKAGLAEYPNVKAEDLLLALQNIGWEQPGTPTKGPGLYDAVTGNPDDSLQAASYYPRFQRMLKEGDIVIAETGTFYYGMSQVSLPGNTLFIGQGAWQSIGYATPAAYGACIAAPSRRVLLFTGDGSLQLTAQEISSMLYYGCKPIIFVLNNDGYTIEKYLNAKTENQTYNNIPSWSYTKLAEAFGGEAYAVTVRTNQELDDAISRAEKECAKQNVHHRADGRRPDGCSGLHAQHARRFGAAGKTKRVFGNDSGKGLIILPSPIFQSRWKCRYHEAVRHAHEPYRLEAYYRT